MPAPQNYGNHARYFPLFHFIVSPILLVYLGYTVWMLTKSHVWPNILAALVAFALLTLAFTARAMAVKVQDRLIRLEERLRMARLLPADLQGRIEEFSVKQLIALRFASDAELPALARTVLEQGIVDGRTIKRMITTWRPDELRA